MNVPGCYLQAESFPVLAKNCAPEYQCITKRIIHKLDGIVGLARDEKFERDAAALVLQHPRLL
jgi:hypothetical protein